MSSPPRNGDPTAERTEGPAPAGEGDSMHPGEGDGTSPGGDDGTNIQETMIKSFGLVIRSMFLDGHRRHFVALLSLRLVEDKLTLHVGDELLMLNWVSLVDLPHEQVVALFRGLRTYMILLFRRRIIEGDFKFYYTAVEATLDIKEMDEEVEHIDVTVLEHKMADDTAIIRWSQSDLLGYIIKSIGDPTKAMFGDSTAILVGTLENTTEYHMDLLMYMVSTPGSSSFAVLVRNCPVFLEVNSSEYVVSTTVSVDLDNPPEDMLFYYNTSNEPRLVQFTAFNDTAEYLATDGTTSLTLNNNSSDPNSSFEVLQPNQAKMAAPVTMTEEQSSRSDSKVVDVSENSDHGQGTLFGCIPCLKLKSSRDNRT